MKFRLSNYLDIVDAFVYSDIHHECSCRVHELRKLR